jgi:hypothetical protein
MNIFLPVVSSAVMYYSDSNDDLSDDPAEISSSIQVQKHPDVATLSMPGKRLASRSSSITSSNVFDHAESPLKKRKSARNKASSSSIRAAAKIKTAVVLDDPKDDPKAKKIKGRKTLNSDCQCGADHNLASGSANLIVASSPASLGSPHSSQSSPPKKVMTKKRKLKHSEFTVEEESATSTSDWESVNECYSRQKKKSGSRYRCTLCLKNNEKHISDREGDMKRHLQSSKHSPKKFPCTKSGCQRVYTRPDSQKRHLNKCMA